MLGGRTAPCDDRRSPSTPRVPTPATGTRTPRGHQILEQETARSEPRLPGSRPPSARRRRAGSGRMHLMQVAHKWRMMAHFCVISGAGTQAGWHGAFSCGAGRASEHPAWHSSAAGGASALSPGSARASATVVFWRLWGWLKGRFGPGLLGAGDGIEGDEHLAHGGDESELGRLSPGDQPSIEGGEA
jgi:hypothetical protein